MAKTTQELNQELLDAVTGNGDIKTIENLITEGAEVKATYDLNRTILHYAAEFNHAEAIKVLLKRGANINATDDDKQQPIHLAAKEGHIEALKVLLDSGANINATDELGHTALTYAYSYENKEAIKVLLERASDIDINARDISDSTALHIAAEYNDIEAIKLLLKRGADINAIDTFRKRPIDYAEEHKFQEAMELLLAREIELASRSKLLKAGFGIAIAATMLGLAGVVTGIALLFTIGLSIPVFAGLVVAGAVTSLGSAYMIGASKHGLDQLEHGKISDHSENLSWIAKIGQDRSQALELGVQ